MVLHRIMVILGSKRNIVWLSNSWSMHWDSKWLTHFQPVLLPSDRKLHGMTVAWSMDCFGQDALTKLVLHFDALPLIDPVRSQLIETFWIPYDVLSMPDCCVKLDSISYGCRDDMSLSIDASDLPTFFRIPYWLSRDPRSLWDYRSMH
jgi:hypothetical protein